MGNYDKTLGTALISLAILMGARGTYHLIDDLKQREQIREAVYTKAEKITPQVMEEADTLSYDGRRAKQHYTGLIALVAAGIATVGACYRFRKN